MFDDTATYLIFTGQIMGGNGLYMIVISREALGYRGHRQTTVCALMHKTMCVYVGWMSLLPPLGGWRPYDSPSLSGCEQNPLKIYEQILNEICLGD